MKNGRALGESGGLMAVLAVLVVVIVGLVVGIVAVNLNSSGDKTINNNDDLISVSKEMEGWEGPISDSTRAMILTEEIQEKLSSDPNYNSPEAIAEYKDKYDKAVGELKAYIAIEYAQYYYSVTNDLDGSVKILDEVKELTQDDVALEVDYLYAFYYLYEQAGNVEMANNYMQAIDAKKPADPIIDLGKANDEQ